MTRNIHEVNVNHAFSTALFLLKNEGVREMSRNGPVIVAPEPVVTTYLQPTERVLFNPVRDANPVFHLMEAIWMLAGANNVDWLLPFNSGFGKYAEENGLIHGAYGHRWRSHFNFDQIEAAIALLATNENTRQCVMTMWSPTDDFGVVKNDIPCNTHIYFDVRFQRLNMTVCCRSNDVLWGAYGANVVHFSMLQELIASAIDKKPGQYRQFSNNFHIYSELPQARLLLENPPVYKNDRYSEHASGAIVRPLIDIDSNETWRDFLDDCEVLVGMPAGHKPEFYTVFFKNIVWPLNRAYLARKEGRQWHHWLEKTEQCDWKLAFQEWLQRRSAE
jgi:hypothetical protein